MRRLLGIIGTWLALGGVALGQSVIPPPPIGTTEGALGTAYRAISGSLATDPAAAQRAQFAYQMALSRYVRGDLAGATADAALAMALAGGTTRTVILPNVPLGTPAWANAGVFPAANPLTLGSPVLPDVVMRARTTIERAMQASGKPLPDASARYRTALDRYFNGDLEGAKRDARAATALAEGALKGQQTR